MIVYKQDRGLESKRFSLVAIFSYLLFTRGTALAQFCSAKKRFDSWVSIAIGCEFRIENGAFSLDLASQTACCVFDPSSFQALSRVFEEDCMLNLRWPNTVVARAFADANQHVHKDFKKQTCPQKSDHFIYSTPALSVFYFSITACSVLMALVFFYNDMLQKVTIQRTQHF